MRRHRALGMALLIGLTSVGAQGLRLAVLDFTVESDNPQFKYLGKGLAELSSVELAALPGVTLVDREKRNAILDEQAFSLSGAVDPAGSIEIGRLLAVDYLVTGTVLDLFGNLVVTYSLIKTDTGEVVGKRSAEGTPAEYRRVVKEIGLGVASMSGRAAVAAAPEKPAPAKPAPIVSDEKRVELLTTFSEAVEAIDKKDVKTATARLEAAARIDPTDPAVKTLRERLGGGSSKFAVIPPVYYSLDNPASLGSLTRDVLYVSGGGGGVLGQHNEAIGHVAFDLMGQYGGAAPNATGATARYSVREVDARGYLGYALPLAPGLGLSLQGNFSRVENNVQRIADAELHSPGWDGVNFSGGVLGLGLAAAPWLSLGLAGTVGVMTGNGNDAGATQTSYDPTLVYGGQAGLIVRTTDGSFALAFVAGTNSDRVEFFDMDTIARSKWFQWPVYFDFSLSYGLPGLRDFLVLKYLCDVYGFPGQQSPGGGSAPFMQLMPAYERIFGPALSARLGGVLSMAPLNDVELLIGYGGTLGATLTLGDLELDLSATYRERPSRVCMEELVPELLFGLSLRWRGIIIR